MAVMKNLNFFGATNFSQHAKKMEKTVSEDSGEEVPMCHLFESLLSKTHAPGEFALGGNAPLLSMPGLKLLQPNKKHLIPLPLVEQHAFELIKLGKKSFSHSWLLEPHQFEICNPQWSTRFDSFLHETALSLGLHFSLLKCTLHKLVLLEAGFTDDSKLFQQIYGSHFINTSNGKKFGSLLVQLPSVYTGGSISIQHNGKRHNFDHSLDAEFSSCFQVYFDDCEQYFEPITFGYKLVLVYSLSLKPEFISDYPLPIANRYENLLEHCKFACVNFINSTTNKLIYVLNNYDKRAIKRSNDYCKNLQFSDLQGEDATVAHFLLDAEKKNLLKVYLGELIKYETCTSSTSSPNDITVHESYDEFIVWKNSSNEPANLAVPIRRLDLDNECIGSKRLDEISPDIETSQSSYNYYDVKRTYKTPVLVFWPVEKEFDNMLENNFNKAFAHFKHLFETGSYDTVKDCMNSILYFGCEFRDEELKFLTEVMVKLFANKQLENNGEQQYKAANKKW